MVKADPQQNYYSVLELPTTAVADDIRKQFRKLAFKYHPDRNPGNESQCLPKFQAVQAAHEILGDPISRLKYDVERRKVNPSQSKHNHSSRSSAYSNSGLHSDRMKSQPRPDFTASASRNGTSRFANMPRTSAPKTSGSRDGLKSRQTSAWGNTGTRNPSNPNPTATGGFSERANHRSGHLRPEDILRSKFSEEGRAKNRTAWYSFMAYGPDGRKNGTTKGRKKGFNPSSPGGDEPQAGNMSNYFTSYHSPPPFTEADSPSKESDAQRQEPLGASKTYDETYDLHMENFRRSKSTYPTSGGEKIDMGRFASTNLPSKHPEKSGAEFPKNVRKDTPRHRSSSPTPRPLFSDPASSGHSSQKMRSSTNRCPRKSNSYGGSNIRQFVNISDSDSDELPTYKRPPVPDPPPIFTTESNNFSDSESGAFMPRAKQEGLNSRINKNGKTAFVVDDCGNDHLAPLETGGRTRVSPTHENAHTHVRPAVSLHLPKSAMPPHLRNGNGLLPGLSELRFNRDDWQKKFKDSSWVLPPKSSAKLVAGLGKPRKPPKSSSFPTSRNEDKGRKNVPHAAKVEDAAERSNNVLPSSTGRIGNRRHSDSSAMEIDDDDSAPASVDPSAKINSSSHGEPRAGKGHFKPTRHALYDSFDNFNELRNTVPLSRMTEKGIGDLTDLATTLPFESRPSGSRPRVANEDEENFLNLVIPFLPVAPELPPATQKLAELDVQRLQLMMNSYVREFEKWRERLMSHDLARRSEIDKLGFCGGYRDPYRSTVANDGIKKKMAGSREMWTYLKWWKEDERARIALIVGCKRHTRVLEDWEVLMREVEL